MMNKEGMNAMDKMEKVEKIRKKAGVSYEEAKEALESCGYDMLDAMIYLEKQGKVPKPEVEVFATQNDSQNQSGEFERAQANYRESCEKGNSFGQMMDRFIHWCGKLFKKGWETQFCVSGRKGDSIMKVPVLLLVLAFLLAFWLVTILIVIGLFNGCRFHFEGVDEIRVDLNDVCDKASETCENVKKSFSDK